MEAVALRTPSEEEDTVLSGSVRKPPPTLTMAMRRNGVALALAFRLYTVKQESSKQRVPISMIAL